MIDMRLSRYRSFPRSRYPTRSTHSEATEPITWRGTVKRTGASAGRSVASHRVRFSKARAAAMSVSFCVYPPRARYELAPPSRG
jgi:hypothetical protein